MIESRRYAAFLSLLQLLGEKITAVEYRSLYHMIESPDEENLVVAEEIIKEKCK
jgi:hypothetical protein